MEWIKNKNSGPIDTLDFCLQKHDASIIVTLLINQVPLYDCIIQKEAEFTCSSKEEKKEFLLESYNFDIYPKDEIEEENLFYYNFPQNLSPVDYKHPMIGFEACFTYHALVCPFSDLEMFYLEDKKIPENDFDDIYFDKEKQLIICLVHTCGSIGCSNISMEIKQIRGNIEWMNFYSFDEYLHNKTKFKFDQVQYFEVLQRLKSLNNNLKTYQDYSDFEIERWNNSQSESNENNI